MNKIIQHNFQDLSKMQPSLEQHYYMPTAAAGYSRVYMNEYMNVAAAAYPTASVFPSAGTPSGSGSNGQSTGGHQEWRAIADPYQQVYQRSTSGPSSSDLHQYMSQHQEQCHPISIIQHHHQQQHQQQQISQHEQRLYKLNGGGGVEMVRLNPLLRQQFKKPENYKKFIGISISFYVLGQF